MTDGLRNSARQAANYVAVVLASFLAVGLAIAAVTAERRDRSLHPIYWGAVIGRQLTGGQAPWDWTAVTYFQRLDAGGKALSILHWGSSFYSTQDCRGPCRFTTSVYDKVRRNGVMPFLSWQTTSSAGDSGFSDAEIADGSQDAYIEGWAHAAKVWGHPLFLRFDWEMNGTWFPWGVGVNGNTPADYVRMWRHVHDIFTAGGARNVTWVWCPNIDPGNRWTPLARLYPGDSYVDWTCLDGYNTDAPWTSFRDLFRSTYERITRSIAPSKPMMVGETASTEKGGSKAKWIEDMLSLVPMRFPKIRGLLWYDVYSRGPGNYSDWPIDSSRASEAAFATGIKSSIYTRNRYAHLSVSPIPPPSLGGTTAGVPGQ